MGMVQGSEILKALFFLGKFPKAYPTIRERIYVTVALSRTLELSEGRPCCWGYVEVLVASPRGRSLRLSAMPICIPAVARATTKHTPSQLVQSFSPTYKHRRHLIIVQTLRAADEHPCEGCQLAHPIIELTPDEIRDRRKNVGQIRERDREGGSCSWRTQGRFRS